jgi:hypothetical protein
MYDAQNTVLEEGGGKIILHLNSDEQVFPGLYAAVEFFEQNPETHIAYGDAVVVDLGAGSWPTGRRCRRIRSSRRHIPG